MPARAVVLGDAVLLGRNDRGEDELPGGRPEPGERPEDAVVREVREEAGLDVHVVRALGDEPFEVLPGRWVVLIGFLCADADSTVVPVRSEEPGAMRFEPVDRLGSLPLPAPYRLLVSGALDD